MVLRVSKDSVFSPVLKKVEALAGKFSHSPKVRIKKIGIIFLISVIIIMDTP